MEKMMILVIDGCAPEYLTPQTAPDLYRLTAQHGFAKTVLGAIPSVTNVNHACILSGQFPEATKVVGNYYYDPVTHAEGFIEERGVMQAQTILQAYQQAGGKTALLTVKGKVLGVYGAGADIGISVQTPDKALLDNLGLPLPPQVQDPASTEWILQAALACIEKEQPDLVYCTNNDFVFHHYGPQTAEAKEQIRAVNDYVKKIHELDPQRRIYITADHGMNQKTRLLNLQTLADNAGLKLFCLPPLKDRYVENHIYQEGGILYIFLEQDADRLAFLRLASSAPEVERILTGAEAGREFQLPAEQLGDYVLLAAPGCAFGEVRGERLTTDAVRTHGSLYEREVPLLAINPQAGPDSYRYSKDITAVALNIKGECEK